MNNITTYLLLAILAFITVSKAIGDDSTSLSPISHYNMKLNCTLNWGATTSGTINNSGPYGGSVRAWETNYTDTNNGSVVCQNGSVLIGINSQHANNGGHYWSDIYGTCQQLSVTCSWS